MASPRKPSDKQAADPRQEAGEGSGAGGNESSPRQQQTDQSVPPPPPTQQQVQGGDAVPVTGTQTEEVPVSTGTVTLTVPYGGGSSRKRERNEAGGSSSSAAGGSVERRPKKKGELVEIPRGPPVCYVCNREFQSWKAVFGHMRAHKIGEERARSGAFPPPVFTPPGSPEREERQALQQQLAPTLLNIAQEVLTRPQDSAAASSSASTRRPHIDLNVEFQPSPSPTAEAEPEPAAEPSSPSTGGDQIDLNRPPKNGGDN